MLFVLNKWYFWSHFKCVNFNWKPRISLCCCFFGHSNVCLEFGSFLYSSVTDGWSSSQKFILELSIVLNDNSLLSSSKSKHNWFIFFWETIELSKSLGNFFLDHRKNNITFICHFVGSNSKKSCFEWRSSDCFWMCWVVYMSENFLNGSINNLFHLILKIGILEVLNWIQHWYTSLVEMSISIKFWVVDEVDNSTLLDVFVLTINSIILELFFGVSNVSILLKLNYIGPLVSQLLEFVVGVHIVEYWELWTEEEWEVSCLNETNVEGNKELMMPDHCSEPVIVLPTTKSWDGVDWSNVKEHE